MSPEEKEKYRLHSMLPQFRRKVEEAKSLILEAEAMCSPWIPSFSAGKDSTVLIDLIAQTTSLDDILFFRYPETPEENVNMVRRVEKEYGVTAHIVDVPGEFTVYEQVGRFFIHPATDEERRLAKSVLQQGKRIVNRYVEDGGWKGQYIGMRKEESRRRRIVLNTKGSIYHTTTRKTLTCTPLAGWSGRDIWAYILINDLPYLSVYDADPERGRERLRSEPAFFASPESWLRGEAFFVRTQWPDVWERAARKWPEISQYL